MPLDEREPGGLGEIGAGVLLVVPDEAPVELASIELSPIEWKVVVLAAQGDSLGGISARLELDLDATREVVDRLWCRGLMATIGPGGPRRSPRQTARRFRDQSLGFRALGPHGRNRSRIGDQDAQISRCRRCGRSLRRDRWNGRRHLADRAAHRRRGRVRPGHDQCPGSQPGRRPPHAPRPKQDQLHDVLAALVAKGTITQAQADAITKAMDDARAAHGPGKGHGQLAGMFGFLRNTEKAVADAIGITPEQLRDELRGGSTIAEVAKAHGVAESTVVDAIVSQATEKIDQAVSDGHLTEAQAAKLKRGIRDLATKVVEGRGLGFGGGFGGPGRGDRPGRPGSPSPTAPGSPPTTEVPSTSTPPKAPSTAPTTAAPSTTGAVTSTTEG